MFCLDVNHGKLSLSFYFIVFFILFVLLFFQFIKRQDNGNKSNKNKDTGHSSGSNRKSKDNTELNLGDVIRDVLDEFSKSLTADNSLTQAEKCDSISKENEANNKLSDASDSKPSTTPIKAPERTQKKKIDKNDSSSSDEECLAAKLKLRKKRRRIKDSDDSDVRIVI